MTVSDPSSLSNVAEVKTTHLHLDWTVSFEKRNIAGHVILDMIATARNVHKVVLDTSYLDIQSVFLNDNPIEVRKKSSTRRAKCSKNWILCFSSKLLNATRILDPHWLLTSQDRLLKAPSSRSKLFIPPLKTAPPSNSSNPSK